MATSKLTRFKDGRYCLDFYLDGKRRRETFTGKQTAQSRQSEIDRLKGKGLQIAAKDDVAIDEAAQYATNALTAKGITKPLTAVVDEYIAAHEALGDSGTLVEACQAHARNREKLIPIKVPDLVDDYERHLIGQKVGKDHLNKTIKIYLKRFAAAFAGNIDQITLKDLVKWRSTFTTTPRTVNNYCNAAKALFNFAQDHNHLRRDRKTEASRLKDIEETPTPPDPFTLEEMAILLTEVDDKSLPYIVMGGFAGIRTAELKRLDWGKHVRWDIGYFDLTGNVTKKKLRRLIPILPAAAAWLAKFKGRTGRILDEVHPERHPTTVLEAHGLKWRHNGLRDAFGSNRTAVVKNLNQIALEMGNSPDVVVESYREVFTEEQAEKFWQLTPTEAEKLKKRLGLTLK